MVSADGAQTLPHLHKAMAGLWCKVILSRPRILANYTGSTSQAPLGIAETGSAPQATLGGAKVAFELNTVDNAVLWPRQ
jgi:hypothetical protein